MIRARILLAVARWLGTPLYLRCMPGWPKSRWWLYWSPGLALMPLPDGEVRHYRGLQQSFQR